MSTISIPERSLRTARPVGAKLRTNAIRVTRRATPPGLLLLALLALWQGASTYFHIKEWLLPSPTEIATALGSNWALISTGIWPTLQESLVGFAMGLGVGVFLALLIHYSKILQHALYPLIIASQTVPTIAIAPILVVWFGYNLLPKVMVVALFCFFPIAINTVAGLNSSDPDMKNMLRTLEASHWKQFRYIELPASLPAVFTGLKIAITFSVIGAVIGEWVGSTQGLGYLLLQSTAQFLTARGFAILVVLSTMGIALFGIVSILQYVLVPWLREESKRREAAK